MHLIRSLFLLTKSFAVSLQAYDLVQGELVRIIFSVLNYIKEDLLLVRE